MVGLVSFVILVVLFAFMAGLYLLLGCCLACCCSGFCGFVVLRVGVVCWLRGFFACVVDGLLVCGLCFGSFWVLCCVAV